jgi:hypothetical protein
MNIIWIAAAAFAGGIVAALLGWLESKEPFDARKFSASVARALVAAVAFAVGYHYANSITPVDIGIAFCGGAGFDVLGHRVSAAIKAGME